MHEFHKINYYKNEHNRNKIIVAKSIVQRANPLASSSTLLFFLLATPQNKYVS